MAGMSTPYQRGAAFEHRVKRELEAEGYLVTRSPASKSPYDLLAIPSTDIGARYAQAGHEGYPLLIQCKLRGVIGRVEREALIELAKGYACGAVLAYQLPDGRLVHYRLYDDGLALDWSP